MGSNNFPRSFQWVPPVSGGRKHRPGLDSFLKIVAHQIKDDIDHLLGPATASNHSSMETVSRHQQQLMDDPKYVAIYEDLKNFPPKIGE